jgi:D-arabinose 1-dehydrogenase-like Zn-dependent alcohol dehydrogenase
MGFRTVAIARGADKEPLARQLGASAYIDNAKSDPAVELAKLGGAAAVLATVTESAAMASTIGGLATKGTLMVIGAVGPMTFDPLMILRKNQSIRGWYSGTSIDSQDTLRFSVLTGVRSMNEVIPFARASEGYDRMMSGKARFRVILEIST